MKNDTIIITSSLLFTIAFVFAFLIYESGFVISGLMRELNPILYHNTMSYTHISDPADYIAFGGGPALILVAGLLVFITLKFFEFKNGILRLFLTWFSFICFTLFLIQLPVIPFTKGGDLARFLSNFQIPIELKFLLAGSGILLIILLGLMYGRIFLSFAPSEEVISGVGKRRIFILKIALIPWLFGALFSLPFRVPPFSVHYLMLPFITGQATVWSLIGAYKKVKIKMRGLNSTASAIFQLLVVLVLLLIFFQLGLTEGIKF
ncbi:MAG: hypothetical protein Kow0098_01150 [Ignavibacteriaceae bacterium]